MIKRVFHIFARYLFILIAGLLLPVFYIVLLPLTIYPSNFIISLFYSTNLINNTIYINNASITLIDACIAGSAYYLLLLLNFAMPMKAKTRVFSLLFSFFLFLIINIARISLFSILFLSSFQYFDFAHKLTWYLMSGVFVFLVWILTIKVFDIKDIPFYTDLKFIYNKKP